MLIRNNAILNQADPSNECDFIREDGNHDLNRGIYVNVKLPHSTSKRDGWFASPLITLMICSGLYLNFYFACLSDLFSLHQMA